MIPEVVYKLEAEPQRRFARVELVGAKDENKKFVEGIKMVLNDTQEVCSTEIALLMVCLQHANSKLFFFFLQNVVCFLKFFFYLVHWNNYGKEKV